MEELMLMLAKEMPMEMLIEQLEEKLAEFKITGKDDGLGMYCMMISLRLSTEDKSTTEVVDQFKQNSEWNELNPNKKKQ